jgi:hypothetical protein
MVSYVEVGVLTLFGIIIAIFAGMAYNTWRGDKFPEYIPGADGADGDGGDGGEYDDESIVEEPTELPSVEDIIQTGGSLLRKYKRVRKFGVTGLLIITLLVVTFGTSTYSSILRALNDL